MGAVTILDSLRRWAAEQPDELAFSIDNGERATWAELESDVRRLAGGLAASGVVAGEVVAVAMPTCLDVIGALFALQWMDAVPMVVNPWIPAATTARRLDAIGGRRIVTNDDTAAASYEAAGLQPLLAADLRDAGRDASPEPRARLDGVAFLQQTSGTMGEPKASTASHRALMANLDAQHRVVGEGHVYVSWVPLFHDMGLITFVLGPVHRGRPTHLLQPSFANIGRWIQTIATVGGTLTAAPDLAFRAAAKLGTDVDLSSLRFACCGGEPVRASSVAAFEQRFGLGPVVRVGYGLAEVVAGVTMVGLDDERRSDGRGILSCGTALPGVEIEIRDVNGDALPSGEVGEIVVRSASLFDGYWRDPEATAAVLIDGWLHTGDLGSLDADGHLYVSGRRRAMIKRGGELIPAHVVEEVVDQLDGVRRSAAIGVTGKGGAEELVVVVDYRGPDPAAVEREAAGVVKDALGIAPSRVLVGGRGVVPMTENGKIRHAALRDAYEAGELSGLGARA